MLVFSLIAGLVFGTVSAGSMIKIEAPSLGNSFRTEALHRLAALGKRDALSSTSPVASGYERGAAS